MVDDFGAGWLISAMGADGHSTGSGMMRLRGSFGRDGSLVMGVIA